VAAGLREDVLQYIAQVPSVSDRLGAGRLEGHWYVQFPAQSTCNPPRELQGGCALSEGLQVQVHVGLSKGQQLEAAAVVKDHARKCPALGRR
jgi:hypothetical protein